MFSAIIIYLFEVIARVKKLFITFHLRPVVSCTNSAIDFSTKPNSVAILIQGPLIRKNNFTLETIKLYQKNFPNQFIILSTWQDEPINLLDEVFNCSTVHLILSKKPASPGLQHINYQIVSSKKGALYAKKLGCRYLLKTRTDQRMYSANILSFLIAMLNQFPVKPSTGQKMRIISSSLYSFKYRLYSISDMFLFGHIEDMLLYLSPKLDSRSSTPKFKNLKEYSKLRLGEMYFVTEFLKSLGHKIKWTLEDSWNVYKKRFCICDKESIDIFWYKYDMFKEYKYIDYGEEKNSAILSFKDWFLLYSLPLKKKFIPEITLGKNFTDAVEKRLK